MKAIAVASLFLLASLAGCTEEKESFKFYIVNKTGRDVDVHIELTPIDFQTASVEQDFAIPAVQKLETRTDRETYKETKFLPPVAKIHLPPGVYRISVQAGEHSSSLTTDFDRKGVSTLKVILEPDHVAFAVFHWQET